MSPLRDLRVLEIGEGVAGAWCARLLGGLGATVLKIEPPGGDATRRVGPSLPDGPPSALFRLLNAGKQSHSLDLAVAADRARLADLVRRCDVLVETLPPGALAAWPLHPAALRRAHPALVIVSLTPFGQSGPRRAWRADELVLQAEGGLLHLTGWPHEPPRRVAGLPAQMAAGLHGAVAVLAALASGRGGWIDLSIAAVVASLLEGALTEHAYSGADRQRSGNRRPRNHPMTVLPCRDGYAGVFVASPADWETFARFAGHPEWADDPRFATPAARWRHADALDALLIAWLTTWDRAPLFAEAQAWRLPFTMALGVDEVRADPHLRARDFWAPDGLPGPPFHMAELSGDAPCSSAAIPWRSGPAPALGSAADLVADIVAEPPAERHGAARASQPLAGLRVLDLTALWAGPYATRLLADLGAEVVKVEGPWRPDGTRGPSQAIAPHPIYPHRRPGTRPYNRAALFNELNRNKRGLALDLRQPAALALLHALVARADVLIESFSPRVLPNWGLDDAALARLNPRLIVVHLPAFGAGGPYGDAVALGGGLDLMSGLAGITGLPGPPLLAGVALPDPVAGATAALAALAALRWRQRCGRGVRVEVAQWEATLQLVGPWLAAGAPPPCSPADLDPPAAPRGIYPCRGRAAWLALTVDSDLGWAALCAVLDAPALAADRRFARAADRARHAAALDAALAEYTRRHQRFALAARLQRAGIAAGVVRRPADLARDAQLDARGFFLEISHPEAGTHRYPGAPWRCDAWPPPPAAPAPCFGADNGAVLRDWLGLSAAQVACLEADGTIAAAPRI